MASSEPIKRIGRYELHQELAHGGMAAVHLGRLVGPVGFSRTVAIKRMHPTLLKDRHFRDMFVDEARLAARIRHPNVVPIIDVVQSEGELFLVMDFVQGVSLQRLLVQSRQSGVGIPIPVAAGIAAGALHGLHAAHEAKGDHGERLNIVHRDVSPQNIMVATDGAPRVLDFGIAKARGRLENTQQGQVKGKFAYMPPEQLFGEEVNCQADVYAAGVVLWELLAGRRLFKASTDVQMITHVLQGAKDSPRAHRPEVPEALSVVVMKAISPTPGERFANAREFALALEECIPVASATQIGRWVEELAAEALEHTASLVAEVESQPSCNIVDEARRVSDSALAGQGPPESKSNVGVVVAGSTAVSPRRPDSSRYALAGAVGLVAAVVATIALRGHGEGGRQQVQPARPSPAVADTAPTPPPPSTTASQVATVAASPPAPSTGDAEAPARRVAAPMARVRTAPRPRMPVAARPAIGVPAPTSAPAHPPARVADCDPPYTLDSRGIQRIKPSCL